ncbi:HNH endonuclease signature motif containing protein, partial [Nocardioides sp. MH1]|uniref:HNH endonuclease signature motif containing protein n=1 Tax=Nocardioides sp. MH1 TaxID=3242490 RepID=UPI003520C111
LFTTAQRRAMALIHPTCIEERCAVPARECEAHHLKPWSQGGHTDLKDARPACNHHHHLIHDPTYTHHTLPNGTIRFHRKR